jgi:enediyne biosynthesis protein E4
MTSCRLNGAMLDNVHLYHSEVTYKEPLLMFRNLGKGQFAKVSESLGPDFMRPIAGRGLATADYDNDGDIDIALIIAVTIPNCCATTAGTPITG